MVVLGRVAAIVLCIAQLDTAATLQSNTVMDAHTNPVAGSTSLYDTDALLRCITSQPYAVLTSPDGGGTDDASTKSIVTQPQPPQVSKCTTSHAALYESMYQSLQGVGKSAEDVATSATLLQLVLFLQQHNTEAVDAVPLSPPPQPRRRRRMC
uniref:Chemotactic signal-response protein CheL n=1 Tax=Lygus hesperus TaxID=30085 RepID=A0A0A9WZE0_LYGHE